MMKRNKFAVSTSQSIAAGVKTALAASFIWALAAVAHAAEAEAEAWLKRMAVANSEHSYRGVFIYQRGNDITSTEVVHRVRDGLEQARLLHLDGDPVEVLREGNKVTCVHAEDEVVRLEQSLPTGPFASSFTTSFAPLIDYYDLEVTDEERVAGRATVKLSVFPKDKHRYSFHLWLDEASGLLLKSAMTDQYDNVLERFQFATIELGADISDDALRPTTHGRILEHQQLGESPFPSISQSLNWGIGWVPPGFTKFGTDIRRAQTSSEPQVEAVMFSDGLAAFTVFVEPVVTDLMPEGSTSKGATVAFSRVLDVQSKGPHMVTVVGEVPPHTAQKIAEQVYWENNG